MTALRDAYVALLKSQVGYHEGRDPNGLWNNIQKFSLQTPGLEWSNGQPWCAVFEAWGAHQLGVDKLWPMTASCSLAVSWWQKQNRFTPWPVLGGPFYLGPGGADHTGVVWKYDTDNIWTVEGNTNTSGSYQGDGVYLRIRPRRGDGSPYGYGIPAFPEGVISADPKWGGVQATEVPLPQPTVSLADIVAAAHRDPGLPQGATTHKAEVLLVEDALCAEGYLDRRWVDGSFGTKTVEAYAELQRAQGYSGQDANGIPGMTTLSGLGRRHSFRVVA